MATKTMTTTSRPQKNFHTSHPLNILQGRAGRCRGHIPNHRQVHACVVQAHEPALLHNVMLFIFS